MTGLRIVVPAVRDAEPLGRLHHLVRREMYRQVDANVPESTVQDAVASWQERLQYVDSAGCHNRGCTLRAAFGSEQLVGFVVAGPGRDLGWEAMGELWALSVHPEWRGSGVADALVDAALPAGLAYLWVLQGNARAIALLPPARLHRRRCGPGGSVHASNRAALAPPCWHRDTGTGPWGQEAAAALWGDDPAISASLTAASSRS